MKDQVNGISFRCIIKKSATRRTVSINKIRNGPELRKGSLQFEMRFIKLTCYSVGETVRRRKRREKQRNTIIWVTRTESALAASL